MHTISVCFSLTLTYFLLFNFESAFGDRRFYIDFEKNEFIKDGEVFRYVSGSMHYFRVPRPYWRDRIQKMKAAGLNAVSTYIEWSLHEPYSGIYNFEGQADFEEFLTIAKQENMLVLLRPGPFISAERDFGGFPYWLLKEKPSLHLRSSDPNYTKFVGRWFSVLMPKLVPHLYGNGGNIIMVQVENEYGYNDISGCDEKYKLWLRDLINLYVNGQALLYTTDVCHLAYLKCGHIPNVYSTVDFGANYNPLECFGHIREVEKKGPLVNSEYYDGWVAHWDEKRPLVGSPGIVRVLKQMLALNASINFLMFHGGTNFGFTSGSSANGSVQNPAFKPQLTTYDFSAPLLESGDPTEKYYAIKRALKQAKFTTYTTSKIKPKGEYGVVSMLPMASLFDLVSQHMNPITNNAPLCFEDMDINHGLVLYETDLPKIERNEKLPLVIEKLHDRAYIYLDNLKLGIMSRSSQNTTMELSVSGVNKKLKILVENQGRVNDKKFLYDKKGILSNVTLGRHVLGPWIMTGYPLNDTLWLESQDVRPNVKPPAFYRGVFIIPQNEKHTKPLDTFLDTSGWSKGVAYINNINIGRYWPAVGPQITLYVPATYLVPGLNTIVMLELESAPEDFTVKFVDKPRLDW